MSTSLLALAPPLSAAFAVTRTCPLRRFTVSLPVLSISALSVGEPSGSVTVQYASFSDASSGSNEASKSTDPYGTRTGRARRSRSSTR